MEGPEGAEDPALGCRVKKEKSHGGERSTKVRDRLTELQGVLGCTPCCREIKGRARQVTLGLAT